MVRRIILSGFVGVFFFTLASAQSSDSLKKNRSYKNILKVNLTSNILYRSPLIEYERIVAKNQSFSLQFGLIALPFGSSKGSDSLNYQSSVKKAGFSITADYRFYLAKENRDPAPHGVYLAPYVAYCYFDNERNMTIGASPDVLLLSAKLQVLSIGAQLGYQFVLGKKKHWTIDCIVIGPSLTNYVANLNLTGNIDPGKINGDLQKILEGLANRYPVIGDLLKNQEADFKGTANTWSAGFRYSVHVGYRF